MVYEADPALKRAIKFFKEQTVVQNQDGTPVYYDKSSDRFFANIFIASALPSKNNFTLNGPYMKDWINGFQERPIVLFKKGDHYAHPTLAEASKEVDEQFQQSKKVGLVKHIFEPDENFTFRGVGEIVISKVKDFLKALKTEIVPMFTSPSMSYYGNDHDIRKATPRHVALTDDPAFPPEISRITGICEGPEAPCLTKLAEAKNAGAGEKEFVCFGDAIEDLVLNAAADNTSLKIIDFKSNLSDMVDKSKDSEAGSEQITETEDKNKKTPAEITEEIIKTKAKEAFDKMIEDHKAKLQSNEKADPKATFDKAAGNEKKNEDTGSNTENIDYKTQLDEVNKKLAAQELINRKNEIAKRIPIAMVTDVKSGGVNEKLLEEVVNYWVDVKDKTPEQIGEFLEKQTLQVEAVNSAKIPKKAEGSNEKSLSDNELAEQMSTRFDAPDADSNREKHAEAAAKEAAWQYELAGMLVSNVSKEVGKGAPRRILQ